MQNKRYDYLDITKGIGILLVVWAHILTTGWTHKMIYAFHMPLFFLVSGMLLKNGKYNSFGSFFTHRAKRLLIPYAIYSVATWVFWATFRYVRHDEVDSFIMPLLQTFMAQGSGAFFAHNSALWFIPCLFLVEILYFFISKLGKLWSVVICFGLAATSFLLGNTFGDGYWLTPLWNADAAFIALPFYCVGNLVIGATGHETIVKHISNYKLWYLLIWICLTSLLFWSSMNFGECSMGSSSYQCDGWIFMSRAFLGCIWLIILSVILSKAQKYGAIVSTPTRYLKWAGIKSLDIMCLHIPIKGIAVIIVAMALHCTVDDVSSNMLLSTYAFVLTMIAVWLVIKFIVQNISKINLKSCKE